MVPRSSQMQRCSDGWYCLITFRQDGTSWQGSSRTAVSRPDSFCSVVIKSTLTVTNPLPDKHFRLAACSLVEWPSWKSTTKENYFAFLLGGVSTANPFTRPPIGRRNPVRRPLGPYLLSPCRSVVTRNTDSPQIYQSEGGRFVPVFSSCRGVDQCKPIWCH